MARTKTISSIDGELTKLMNTLSRLDKKREIINDKILQLQKEKQEIEAMQIMEAFRASGKSLNELMIFLGA